MSSLCIKMTHFIDKIYTMYTQCIHKLHLEPNRKDNKNNLKPLFIAYFCSSTIRKSSFISINVL